MPEEEERKRHGEVEYVGRQAEETLNRNGRRLLDVCAVHELVVLK